MMLVHTCILQIKLYYICKILHFFLKNILMGLVPDIQIYVIFLHFILVLIFLLILDYMIIFFITCGLLCNL